ncbi:S9 family peptidase [Candidatus Acetothermia bacterium]|nr:S9 family peptidase [Candidatus Acetothermia bacterium]MCI2432230.1 S9 family peptidase [Candidatus Acetothermia bacterium]MCI2436486.1 S9 family peptidase [Candidatus Acetothermia bacterium]
MKKPWRRKILLMGLVLLLGALSPSSFAHYEVAQEPLTQTPKYSIAQYLDIQSSGSGRLSPDGTELLYVNNATGTFQIYKLDLQTHETVQLTDFEDGVSLIGWTPQSNGILFGKSTGGSERTQLYWLSPDSTELIDLSQKPESVHRFGAWSPDGTKFAFSANRRHPAHFDIYIQNLETKEIELVYQSDKSKSVVGWSPEGRYLVISVASASTNNDLYLLDLETKELKHLTPHEGNALYDAGPWTPDGAGFFVLSDQDREFTNLAYLHIHEGRLEFLEDLDFDVEDVALSPDGKNLVTLVNVEGYHQIRVWTWPERGWRPAPLTPPGLFGSLRFSQDGTKLTFTLTGSRFSSDVWLYDLETHETLQITQSALGEIPAHSFIEPRLIKYSTFDDRKIPALFYLPQGAQRDGSLPVIIDIHGGPEAQARPSFSRVHQYFLNAGYALLRPNVRGSTGYGKTFMSLDDVYLREDSVKDIAYAVEWLKQSDYIDPEKIVVMGASYGGYMVLASLTLYPELFAAGINIVGIANFVTFLERTAPYRRHLRESEYGSLKKDREFLASISPIHRVDKIRAPLFVIHGANDPRVPISEAEQIVTAIRQRNGMVEYLRFEDEGHGLAKRANQITAYTEVVEFLERYLLQKSVGATGRSLLQIEDLVKTFSISAPAISPDGRWLAFSSNRAGNSDIYLMPAEGGEWKRLTFSPEAESGPQWSPDGTMLLYSADVGGNEVYDIYLISLEGGEPVNLTNTPDVDERGYLWSPDGTKIAFTAAKNGETYDLYLMSADGSNRQQLTATAGPESLAAWSPDGRRLAFTRRSDPRYSEGYLLSLEDRQERKLNLPAQANNSLGSFSPDGTVLVFQTDTNGTGDIALYDLESDTSVWLANDSLKDEFGGGWSSDGNSIAYIENNEGNFEIKLKSLRENETRTVGWPSGLNNSPRWFPDGKRLAFTYSGPTQPTNIWTLDLETEKLKQLTFSFPPNTDKSLLVKPELVRYPSFDGLEIPAWLYKPKTLKPGERLPAILLIHGGPSAQWLNGWNLQIQLLVSHGFIVLAPNVRGSTGYGKAFEELNDRDWGGGDLRDLVAGREFLIKTGLADEKRIGITGGSYGGYLTFMALTKYPDLWAAGVSSVGVVNLKTLWETTTGTLRLLLLRELGRPDESEALYYERSPINFIEAIQAPLLVLQGERDPRVPLSEFEQIREKLEALGKVFEYKVYEGEGHGYRREENRLDSLKRTLEFFSKYLKLPSP